MKPLKADFHVHTAEDPQDYIRYSAKELIEMAAAKGFSVLAITNHNSVEYSDYLRDFARERGIILVPGMEATIEGRHVVALNMDFSRLSFGSLKSIQEAKARGGIALAPHPFSPATVALGKKLLRYRALFDCLEFCHCYTRHIDFNRRAMAVAKELGLPLVGTSDAHQRGQFGITYSLVYSEPQVDAVLDALRQGRVEVVSRPLRLGQALEINLRMVWRNKFLGPLKRV